MLQINDKAWFRLQYNTAEGGLCVGGETEGANVGRVSVAC